MPRPRLPGTVSAPQSTLERYPDHVQAIGMVTVELANLEIDLGELLGAMLHINPQFGHVIYHTPRSTIARLQILENVAREHLVKNTEGRKHIESLVARAAAVMGKRHDFIHETWGLAAADPTKVMRRRTPFSAAHPAKPVSIEELEHLIRDMRELSSDVRATTKDAYASWPPYTWPKKHRGSLSISEIEEAVL